MKKERDGHWDTNKHIVTYFTKVELVRKRLKHTITVDDKELLRNALYTIKASGQMEWVLKEWDKKADTDKTWKNFKYYFSKEYANHRKHKLVEAKQAGFANQTKESHSENIKSHYENNTNNRIWAKSHFRDKKSHFGDKKAHFENNSTI